jgi:hypothetical protein
MSFLAPLAFLAAAIAGPIIVAMYLLKLRREDHVVSSTFLWRGMIRDVEANAPWQKLRPNLLLLLQLLILLLLVLALARPFFQTTGIAGRNLILIIDRSASMGAMDGSPTRLDAAKDLADRLVGQLPDNGRATIIAAGGQMEVPASSTSDRRELRQAIANIALRHGGGSDLAQPLALAAALAAREPQSEIAVISDGNVSFPDDQTMPVPVRYFPIGREDNNVAINAVALQQTGAGQVLFVQAINYGQETVTRRLDVYLNDALFNAYNLTLQPGQERSVVEEVDADVTVAEARLSGEDVLPLDDQAWAVRVLSDDTRVRLVGDGNYFLETGLSLLPGVQVDQESATWSASQDEETTAAKVPVTILDGVVPTALPAGNLFFIAPPRSTDYFSVTGEIEFPALFPSPGDDPILRNVSIRDVSILKTVQLVPGSWARVVVDSDETPLLMVGERDGRRIAVLAFDLHQSDLPLHVAFPLVLSNIISYLAPGSGAEAAQLTPGEPLALPIDPAITNVRLTRPDGTQLESQKGVFSLDDRLRIQNDQLVYADTDSPGVYTLALFRGDDLQARLRYAVNLFSVQESAVQPQETLAIPQESGLQSAITRERDAKQEFWRWLAIIALVVVVIEWLVYHKAGVASIRRKASKQGA